MRSSRRNYTQQEIPGDLKQDILSHFSSPLVGPLHNTVRFQLVEKNICEKQEKVKLGTYGFIAGAHTFIVGAVKRNKEKNFEDYGYLLEQIILYCTAIGLASCWLGGSFKRSDFGKVLKLSRDEIIPAITSIGYATEKRGARDLLIRMAAGSKNRKPRQELFFTAGFAGPLSSRQAGAYDIPLEMVRLAPSASNNQPWRIVQQDNCYHFFLKRTKNYDKMMRAADLQRIDMGIAMYHFESTARELNLKGKWQVMEIDESYSRLHDGIEYIVSWLADAPKTD